MSGTWSSSHCSEKALHRRVVVEGVLGLHELVQLDDRLSLGLGEVELQGRQLVVQRVKRPLRLAQAVAEG